MTTVSVVTAQPGTRTASNGCTSTVTMRTRFTHDYNGPYWRAEWWAQVPISKRGAQLRDTRDSERRDDFDIRRQGWTRRRPAGAKIGHRKLTGVPKAEVAGLFNEKVAETSGTRLPRSGPT
jgi:hypothetical protein